MRRLLVVLTMLAFAASASAREVYPLNEGWRFFFRTENSSDNARYVTLPHSWNTDPRAEGAFLETTGNYLQEFHVPARWRGRRIFVRFYGAHSVADLFVNGLHAGSHRGGGTAFAFEITDLLRYDADNALLAVVSNGYREDVLPTSTDMNLYGGLYREAELIVTDRTAVSPLWLGTDGVLVRQRSADRLRAEGDVEVHLLSGAESNVTLSVTFTDGAGREIFTHRQRVKAGNRTVTVPYAVEKPRLWSPSDPALCNVSVVLSDDSGTLDSVTVRTGLRSLRVTDRGLLVNGERAAVRGVALHHDNALSGGTLTAEDCEADLACVRDMGATALRSVLRPHAPRLYDRCDELGLLAWVDIPLHRSPFLGDVAYYPTPLFEEQGLQQLREIVAQQINHPSVAMWGLFSRLRSQGCDPVAPYLRRLNEEAHRMDPSRPTVACSDQDGEINFITDLIVWRQDVGWQRGSTNDVVIWRDGLRKNWAHLRSAICYGGPGMAGFDGGEVQSVPHPNRLPMRRQTLFHEEYARNLENDSLFWGVWIENMFDYGSARMPYGINASGLVTLDRRDRKDAYYLYRALWNGASPTLRIAGRSRHEGGRMSWHVYSSAGEPLLLVGGDTVRMHAYASCQYRSDTLAVEGPVVVKAAAGALRDSVRMFTGDALKTRQQPVLQRKVGRRTTD